MRYPRFTPLVLLLALATAGCSDAADPVAPAELSYARGGVPGAPARAGLVSGLAVSGVLENGESFAGTLRITELGQEGGQLLASGVLSYEWDGATVTQAFAGVPATLVAAASPAPSAGGSAGPMAASRARCDILLLDLGPIFLDLLGLEVDLSQIVLDIDAVSGAGNLLGNLLCAVTGLLDPIGIIGQISNLLDRINDILDDIGGILADVSGALAGGGAFDGAATIQQIEQTATGTMVSGVLNGTVTLTDGTTQEIVNQAFTTTATLTSGVAGAAAMAPGMSASMAPGMSASMARCDILLLDLGPIFLDLLGLEVDLSQVVLDIDAVSGAGNLLGNLLCAVTGLLDGTTFFAELGGLLDRINRLLDVLG